MRIQQILENSTTAGSVATVAQPMMTQTRESIDVPGLKPVQQVMKGKPNKKGPYANSIVESKVTEDDLAEQDLIVIPGQGRLKRTGFVKHDLDQGEHEGETLKNSLHTIIRVATHLDKRLSLQSEFPEWVSEKIGAVKSNMVTVMDYLISSQEMQHDTDAMEGSDRQWSKQDMERLRVATRDFDDIMASDGPEAFKQELIKKRIKTKPMAGPKGVLPEGSLNELSSALLQRAAQAATDKRNQAMDPKLHKALGGGYMNPLATHYDDVSQKISNRAAKVGKKETIQKIASKIASPAVMRKMGMADQGVAEDDSALQAFLSKGGNVQQLPYKKPRKADKTDYGSRHIGGSGDKMKASRTGTAARTQGNKVAGIGEAFDLDDLRKAAASSRSPEDNAALKRNPDFGKLMQKSVNKHNKAVVKTRQDIGSRIADIGAGGKEYNVKTDAAWDAAKKKVSEG